MLQQAPRETGIGLGPLMALWRQLVATGGGRTPTVTTPTIYQGCCDRWHSLAVPLAHSSPCATPAAARVPFLREGGFLWLLSPYLTGLGFTVSAASWGFGDLGSIRIPFHFSEGVGLGAIFSIRQLLGPLLMWNQRLGTTLWPICPFGDLAPALLAF